MRISTRVAWLSRGVAMLAAACTGPVGDPDGGLPQETDAAEEVALDAPVDAHAEDAAADASAYVAPADCAAAAAMASHYGCEFWLADLDNAASAEADASHAPFGITVTNPAPAPVDVTVERSVAARGEAPEVVEIVAVSVPARSSVAVPIGRFEVDGSSDLGVDDGTHSALSTNGLRVRSSGPVTVVSENPLGASTTGSNGTSLVLPTHWLGDRYTVVAWPQTATSIDPQLRAFLTVLGTATGTEVVVTLGPAAATIVGVDGTGSFGPGDTVTATLGPFEVLNLETGDPLADFSGSVVTATAPIATFVGAEAADVPASTDAETRTCCGDHLEVHLPPDARAGRRFLVARLPERGPAVNAARPPGEELPVLPEPQLVRLVSIGPGSTVITTSLPAPADRLILPSGGVRDLPLDDEALRIEADGPIVVLAALAGGSATGLPADFPLGDPDLFWVPPIEQHVSAYEFAIPTGYPFDAVTIAAPRGATLTLDDAPLPIECSTVPFESEWTLVRCPVSFPTITGPAGLITVFPARQGDGFHSVRADAPIGVVVSGFGSYTGYAHPVGATGAP